MDVATPQSLVAHFYDEKVTPERLQRLLQAWDSAMSKAADEGAPDTVMADANRSLGSAFAAQIASAIEVLEQDLVCSLQVEAILRQVSGAAMVVTAEMKVLAANEAARMVFGIEPGEAFACLPIERSGIDLLAERLDALESGPDGREDVVQFRWSGLERVFHAHIRAIPVQCGRPNFLLVTSELAWPERLSAFMASFFRLTPAEIEVVRCLTAGAPSALSQKPRAGAWARSAASCTPSWRRRGRRARPIWSG